MTMEVIQGIVLCFSEKIKVPCIPSWKKIIVNSKKIENRKDSITIECETDEIYGIKRLALALQELLSRYIITDGVLIAYDGVVFNPSKFTTFMQSIKNGDFIGHGPAVPSSYYKAPKEDLEKCIDDPYILEAYTGCSIPLYPFTKRPKIGGGIAGGFYLSRRSCRILYEHMENIQFDVFTYDSVSSSYPYLIENCAVSYIMYKNDIGVSVCSQFDSSSPDSMIEYLPSKSLTVKQLGVGFFSSCNTRLVSIIDFFNKYHTLPEKVDCTDQFKWYKPEKYYKDITPVYFETRTEIPISFIKPVRITKENCTDEDQFCDYKKYIQYDDLRPFLEAYFQPTPLIQRITRDIIKKYRIDFTNTCVLFYRGNDKINETKLCPYEEVIEKAKQVRKKYPNTRFMIQSDETAFIVTMMDTFPNSFYCSNEIRHMHKRDYTTVDYVFKETNHEFSKKFLAIMWIMSQCKYIVSGSSGNCLLWISYYRGHSNDIYHYLNGEWINNIEGIDVDELFRYNTVFEK